MVSVGRYCCATSGEDVRTRRSSTQVRSVVYAGSAVSPLSDADHAARTRQCTSTNPYGGALKAQDPKTPSDIARLPAVIRHVHRDVGRAYRWVDIRRKSPRRSDPPLLFRIGMTCPRRATAPGLSFSGLPKLLPKMRVHRGANLPRCNLTKSQQAMASATLYQAPRKGRARQKAC